MKNKILVVDDEMTALRIAKSLLEANQYEVITACDGREAIDKLKTIKPDLIIMDVMMPNLDGAETVRLIRENMSSKSIPIIFLTAMVSANDDQISLSINVGDEKFLAIPKPYNALEFLNLVKKALK